MKISINASCPCNSNLKYKKCCLPFHKGSAAPTALKLMRSRFSAYVLHLSTYICKTTHFENKDYTNDKKTWEKDIKVFCEETSFLKLEIIETLSNDSYDFVTFKASLKQDNQDVSFIEKSTFEKINGQWLYKDGIFLNEETQ